MQTKKRAGKGKAIKPVRAWAGVVDGKIDLESGPIYSDYPLEDTVGVFRTREIAHRHYQCVIPVLITPIKRKAK